MPMKAEREQVDGEELGQPELERELRDQRHQERDHDDREQRADERRRERGGQCLARAALLRQRIAVEGGRDRPGLAGMLNSTDVIAPPKRAPQ
jgi:hypothetical protein